MRIAFFVNCFPYLSETFILRQITGLLDLGHEVDIYSEDRPNESAVHQEVGRYGLLGRTTYMDMPAETGYWELPVWPITERSWPPDSETGIPNLQRVLRAIPKFTQCLVTAPRLTFKMLDSSHYGYQAESLSALYRLAKLCSPRRSYDVLHAHFGPVGNSFRFAEALYGAPLVITFHGFDFSCWPKEQGAGVYDKLFQTAEMVITHSEYAVKKLRELGCPGAKCHKLPVSSVDKDRFPFMERAVRPGEAVRILTVARLTEKKGLEFSIRAVAEALREYPNIHYDIVGGGPLRSDLEDLIRKLGVCESVTLHGARDANYIQQMIRDAHLFILASVTAADGDQEGTPVSLLEAQACGLPVISTLHAGIPEIVLHGKSGLLVPERDVTALSDQLLYLLRHPDVWPTFGRAGRDLVEREFDLGQLNKRLVELYDVAIANYRLTNNKGHSSETI